MTPDEYDEVAAAFLRKLAAADMKAWRAHWRMTERGGKDDALSPIQAQKIELRVQPHSAPKPRAPLVPIPRKPRAPLVASGGRAAAIAAGSNTYRRHTGCKRCANYLYYVIGQNCVACAKVATVKAQAKLKAKRVKSVAKAA